MKNKLFVYLFGVLFAVLILLPATNVTVHADEDWSGLYIGAYVGYLSANPDHEERNNPEVYLDPDIESFNRGLLVGYNFQTSSLVYGIEADYGFVNANEGPNINLYGNYWTKFEFERNAHVRARIGYAVYNFLIYAAGGLAIADFTIDNPYSGYGEDDVSPVGWTIGAGIEYMITKKIIIRFEYLYDDYGSENFNIPWNGEPDYYGDVSPTAGIFRAALSFKF